MNKKIILALTLFYFNSIFAQIELNTFDFSINGTDYQVVLETKTWVEAAEVAYSNGGILAEINSQEEQDSIFYHLNNFDIDLFATRAPDGGNASYIWIGGNDLDSEGVWVWDGANDKIKTQFWEGAVDGVAVDSLYNNWGNEPDNFSNQDALGLALINWPRGEAGQWNDVNHKNELFFLIEYDKSVIIINQLQYLYNDLDILVQYKSQTNFDSVHVFINDSLSQKFEEIAISDTVIKFNYFVNESELANLRLYGFFGEKIAVSKPAFLEIFSFENPIISYSTDFEELPIDDFIGSNFIIDKPFAFRNNSIHSIHDYENGTNQSITLTKPIIVSASNSFIKFSDVAIVEPAEENSSFGDSSFYDYVIVEGSKNYNQWLPLLDGYDARLHSDWLNAWNNGGLFRNLYKSHSINLQDTFNEGDTILIRFRMYTNETVNGWGWTIDSLEIQEFPLDNNKPVIIESIFSLEQNYPNPFNPVTRISYSLPKAEHVILTVYNNLGERIEILVDSFKKAGKHEINFDGTNFASGVYFLRLSSKNQTEIKKISLIK